MIYGITLIILGLLAVPSLLLSKKPDAQKWFDKIAPYQGWIGVVFAVFGVIGLISCLLNIGTIATYPIGWITSLVTTIVEAGLGFLLGYNLIVKYVLSKNEAAKQKGEQLLAKLTPIQGNLGIAAIIIGIWSVIANIIW